jgi:hypothetical protein
MNADENQTKASVIHPIAAGKMVKFLVSSQFWTPHQNGKLFSNLVTDSQNWGRRIALQAYAPNRTQARP